MATTTHLGMTYLETDQVDQPIVFNGALDILDAAVYDAAQKIAAGRTVTLVVGLTKQVFVHGILTNVTDLSGTTITGASIDTATAIGT